MPTTIRLLTSLFAITIASSCAQPQGDERLRDKAAIEAQQGQNTVDNRSLEMDARLKRLQRFYQAMSGSFYGKLPIEGGKTYKVRFDITPTIPEYDGDRVRNVDEITFDITNLSLNIQETTSIPAGKDDGFSSGCIYPDMKPKVDAGFVFASTATCPISYIIRASDMAGRKSGSVEQSSQKITQKVLNGEIDLIDELYIEMRSIHKAEVLKFPVYRQN